MDSKSIPDYKPGESLMVRISAPEPGGFAVKLLPNELDGFLPSQEAIAIGKIVPATFVCMNENRALLTYAFMIGTTERVQLSTLTDQENAFAVWADSYPRSFKLRRAIDMVMPPFGSPPPSIKSSERPDLLGDLEKESFTGCVKAQSQKNLSRSAVVLYRGRAVGCIFGKRPMTDAYPTETALELMFADLCDADTDVQIYDLPEGLVLSMSSFFLGCGVEADDNLESADFFKKMTDQFSRDKQTACLVYAEPPNVPSCFGFFFNGDYHGAFDVDDQQFFSDIEYLENLAKKESKARFEACILPPEMMSDRVKFGFNITAINPSRQPR